MYRYMNAIGNECLLVCFNVVIVDDERDGGKKTNPRYRYKGTYAGRVLMMEGTLSQTRQRNYSAACEWGNHQQTEQKRGRRGRQPSISVDCS